MQLMRGSLVGYAAERMMFLFTMMRAAETVDCEISSSALDDLDGKKGTWPDEREAQFERLRDQIERVGQIRLSRTAGRKARPFASSPSTLRACNGTAGLAGTGFTGRGSWAPGRISTAFLFQAMKTWLAGTSLTGTT